MEKNTNQQDSKDIGTDLKGSNANKSMQALIALLAFIALAIGVLIMVTSLVNQKSEVSKLQEHKSWREKAADDDSLKEASKDSCVKHYMKGQIELNSNLITNRDIEWFKERCAKDEVLASQKKILNE